MNRFGMLGIFAAQHPRTTWCALDVEHFGQTGSANLYSIARDSSGIVAAAPDIATGRTAVIFLSCKKIIFWCEAVE